MITEETRRKMQLNHKGMKGKHFSEETKKKIGKANSGKHRSKETRKKLSDAHKGIPNNQLGKHRSEESKKKMSLVHIGKSSGTKGKSMSEEQKKKLSIAHKGKALSEEHKKKIGEALKGKKLGEKNPAWKGGITPSNHLIRYSSEGKLWRKSCLKRDNFTCQKCGQRGGVLDIHHINNFSEFLELRILIENGITLCENCHQGFHKIFGKKNNTREQLEKFFKEV